MAPDLPITYSDDARDGKVTMIPVTAIKRADAVSAESTLATEQR
jgi:hypothetical protein